MEKFLACPDCADENEIEADGVFRCMRGNVYETLEKVETLETEPTAPPGGPKLAGSTAPEIRREV